MYLYNIIYENIYYIIRLTNKMIEYESIVLLYKKLVQVHSTSNKNWFGLSQFWWKRVQFRA